MSHLFRARQLYGASLRPRFGEPAGCTEYELTALERAVGHALPAAYREYLLWMGNDVDGVFRGSEWFAADVMENTAYVGELLREHGMEEHLREPVLAFFCHQGYMVAWFELPAEVDDPPCYFFSEGHDMTAPVRYERFSDFLYAELQACSPARPPRPGGAWT